MAIPGAHIRAGCGSEPAVIWLWELGTCMGLVGAGFLIWPFMSRRAALNVEFPEIEH